MIRRSLFAAAVAFGIPAIASAQIQTGELRDERTPHRVVGELGFFHRAVGMAEVNVAQPSFYGRFTVAELDPDLTIQLDVAWRTSGVVVEDQAAFRAGNPFFGARIAAHGEGWRARGGLGLTLPLTTAYDDFSGGDFTGAFAVVYGSAMQGSWDPWLLSYYNMALVTRGDFEYRHEYFDAGIEGAAAALLPVPRDGGGGNTTFALQLAGWFAGRPIPELAAGVRFQAVAAITTNADPGESNTEGFLALIPFVRGELGDTAFLEGRLVMNLDDPYGFAFDSELLDVWAVYALAGADF